MRKFAKFFQQYQHFGLVALSLVMSLIFVLTGNPTLANWLLGITATLSVIPILWDIWQSLRRGEYGVDILAATAIITSVLMKEYWAGIVIVLMLTGGEALEDYAETRAKKELTALIDRAPVDAHVYKGRKLVDIPVSKVKVGDKLLIKPGEVVPVDCVIIEGASSFDESSLTGESLPVDRGHDSQVLSGSINIDVSVTVKAIRSAEESQYEQIIKLVKSASSSRSPFVRLADRYSIPFTIIAFVIAIATWVWSGDPIRFLSVLVVATPCPLILGAPIALISGMSRAAKHGIIVKTGSALEKLAQAKTIGFDKTGTLTRGEPVVQKVTSYNNATREEVLASAAALEQHSNHLLAKAIVEAATKQNIKLPKVKNVKETHGHGLTAMVGGKQILVGKLQFLLDAGVVLPKNVSASTMTQTTACVAVDNRFIGTITFHDEVRKETKATLTRLKELGIKHLMMATGDNKKTATIIAKKLGITDVRADCLPADKLIALENIQARPVAFVGDGVNDAPVLTAADVGIALGARGSTAASESADVVIMQDDLSRVGDSVAIAKRTFFIAKQSILIGIFISIGLMFIFATGRFKPVYGAAIQEVVDVAVILNALRAHGSWKKRSV